MSKAKQPPQTKEYQRFEKLAKQVLAVPKSEIDKREQERRKNGNGRKTP